MARHKATRLRHVRDAHGDLDLQIADGWSRRFLTALYVTAVLSVGVALSGCAVAVRGLAGVGMRSGLAAGAARGALGAAIGTRAIASAGFATAEVAAARTAASGLLHLR